MVKVLVRAILCPNQCHGCPCERLREEFLKHYHQRSNAESTFTMVKAKFRGKTDTAMKNEVLCKFLCHNIVVIHPSQVELGFEPVFWKDEPGERPDVLPLVRPGQ